MAWTIALSIVLAGAAFAHGDLHGQIEAVSTRIAAEPDRAELYFKRAELRRLHGEWDESAADYDRVAQLDSGFAAVHLGRGKLLLESGRAPAAIVELNRFLGLQPRHGEALLTRARAKVQLGDNDAAAADYADAIAQSRTPEPEHYLEYARALAATGTKGLDAAVTALDEGMAKLGPLPALGLYAIELQVELSNFDDALARLQSLGAGAARQEPWLERRGDILALAGRDLEARQAWRAALAAIEKLPAHIRTNRATAERDARLRSRLATAPPGHTAP